MVYISKTNYKITINSLFFRGFHKSNKISREVKCSKSMRSFKYRMKNFKIIPVGYCSECLIWGNVDLVLSYIFTLFEYFT